MNRKELKVKKEQAFSLGVEASNNGSSIIPALNPRLKPLLRGIKVAQVNQAIAIMKSYTNGFIHANLARME